MIKEHIEQLFARDLQKLTKEIEAYEDESVIWQTINGINNSAGNLCLHLLGNLNTYIGSTLGNTGYIRNREQEFSLKNIPKSHLLEEIGKVKIIIENTINSLTDDQLSKNYPDDILGYPMSTHQFLIHLIGHLNYHLGQINYHRRILTAIKNQVENFIQKTKT
ncbi:MAG: DinB family protein [Ferruginibacter sp.]